MNPYEKLPTQLRVLNIIPIVKNEKKPLIEWSKYQKQKYILKQWEDKGNFAVVCGETSNNLYVVDVEIAILYEKFLSNIDTFTVQTPNGGYHLYFFAEKTPKRAVKVRDLPVDILGEGSYCLCPPSSINAKEYKVVKDLPIKKCELNEILKLLPSPKQNLYKGKLAYIKDQIDILDYVQKKGVELKAYPKGYWQGKCPFHPDEKPSFTVYPSTQSFYCFGCGKGGDIIDFVSEYNGGCGRERAIKILCDEYNIPYPSGVEKTPTVVVQKEKKEKIEINEEELVEYLEEKFNPSRFANTHNLYVFDGGIYSPRGEDIIGYEVRYILNEQGIKDINFVNKTREAIISYIKSGAFKKTDLIISNALVFGNGWMSLDDFQFHEEFDKNVFCLYRLPFDYNPEAKCPKIIKFLNEVVSPEDVLLLQEMIGYCFLRSNMFQKAFMLYGTGANGKTVFLNLVVALLGRRNVSSFSLQELCTNRFAVAELFGKLANIHSDLPKTSLGHETGKFKQLVGEDFVKAEEKFKPFFTFQNTAKLIFASNELPEVTDLSYAFWRRWIIIPFPNVFEKEKANKNLLAELLPELPGFFNFALEGLKRLLRNGEFTSTKTTEEIKKMWLERSNSVVRFVNKCIVYEPLHKELKSFIYSKYVEFCREEDIFPVTERIFTQEFPRYARTSKFKTTVEGKSAYVWLNIKYVEPVEEDKEEKLKKEIRDYIDNLLVEPMHINDICKKVYEKFGQSYLEFFSLKEIIQNMKREGKYAELQENIITKLY